MANKFEQNINYVVTMRLNGEEYPIEADKNPKEEPDSKKSKALTTISNLKAYIRELIDDNYGTSYAEIALEKVPEYLFSESGKYSNMFIPEELRKDLAFKAAELNKSGEIVRESEFVLWNDIAKSYADYNKKIATFLETAPCKLIDNPDVEQDKPSVNKKAEPVVTAAWASVAEEPTKTKTKS